MAISPGAFVALFAITLIAGAIQRLGGQGFGTITVGFTALMAPEHAPVTVLLLGLIGHWKASRWAPWVFGAALGITGASSMNSVPEAASRKCCANASTVNPAPAILWNRCGARGESW